MAPLPPPAYPQKARIALVIFETRSLVDDGTFGYWRDSSKLLAAYACRHGYDFLYYKMQHPTNLLMHLLNDKEAMHSNVTTKFEKKISPLCYLHGHIGRAASWCRIPAIADALSRGYERVVNFGSDAFLLHNAPPIEEIIRSHMLVVNSVKWPPRTISINKTPKLIYASNAPWSWGYKMHTKSGENGCGGPNGDFNVWERSEEAWELLRRFWLTDNNCTQPFDTGGSYLQENSALTNCRPMRLDDYGILCKLRWNDRALWGKLPGYHISSAQDVVKGTPKGRNMRFEMFPKFVRQIPAELETCIATHYVERNFDATIAARELIESDEGRAAFVQEPPVPDAMGLNGTTWVNYCEGRPHCDTEKTVWRHSNRNGRQIANVQEGYREADISKRPPIAGSGRIWVSNWPASHWMDTSVPAIERTEKGLKLRELDRDWSRAEAARQETAKLNNYTSVMHGAVRRGRTHDGGVGHGHQAAGALW